MNKKLATITILKNEKDRFLTEFLDALKEYSDFAVFLDNGSDDGTTEMLQEWLKVQPGKLVSDDRDFKVHESELRGVAWDALRESKIEPDFVYVADADEIPMQEFIDQKQKLMELDGVDCISFRKIELWNDTHYRIDGLWSNYFLRMFRYKDEPWGWDGVTGLHCPPLPKYATVGKQRAFSSGIRIKHLAYKTKELREAKAKFMKEHGNKADALNYQHLLTIDSDTPRLKELKEELEYPTLQVVVTVDNAYSLRLFHDYARYWMYPKDKISYLYVVTEGLKHLLDEMEEFKSVTGIDFDVVWMVFEDEGTGVKEQRAMEKGLHGANKYLKGEYLFFVDPLMLHAAPNILQHMITSDRDVMVLQSSNPMMLDEGIGIMLSETAKQKLDWQTIANIPQQSLQYRLLTYFNALKASMWNMNTIPFPINVQSFLGNEQK